MNVLHFLAIMHVKLIWSYIFIRIILIVTVQSICPLQLIQSSMLCIQDSLYNIISLLKNTMVIQRCMSLILKWIPTTEIKSLIQSTYWKLIKRYVYIKPWQNKNKISSNPTMTFVTETKYVVNFYTLLIPIKKNRNKLYQLLCATSSFMTYMHSPFVFQLLSVSRRYTFSRLQWNPLTSCLWASSHPGLHSMDCFIFMHVFFSSSTSQKEPDTQK